MADDFKIRTLSVCFWLLILANNIDNGELQDVNPNSCDDVFLFQHNLFCIFLVQGWASHVIVKGIVQMTAIMELVKLGPSASVLQQLKKCSIQTLEIMNLNIHMDVYHQRKKDLCRLFTWFTS